MCFNKKVIGGLAAVGLGILAVAPNLFMSALPLLLVAACPLSMLFMGKAMMGSNACARGESVPEPVPVPAGSSEKRLAQLRTQLATINDQQRMLAQQIDELQVAEVSRPPVRTQGEAVPQPVAITP